MGRAEKSIYTEYFESKTIPFTYFKRSHYFKTL